MSESGELRYFVSSPRGFDNEQTLMVSGNEEIAQRLLSYFGNEVNGVFREVSEAEAKRLFYERKVGAGIESAIYHLDEDKVSAVTKSQPKWEDLKEAMVLNTKILWG